MSLLHGAWEPLPRAFLSLVHPPGCSRGLLTTCFSPLQTEWSLNPFGPIFLSLSPCLTEHLHCCSTNTLTRPAPFPHSVEAVPQPYSKVFFTRPGPQTLGVVSSHTEYGYGAGFRMGPEHPWGAESSYPLLGSWQMSVLELEELGD